MFICNDCPRKCNIDREVKIGYCGCGILPSVTRCSPHFGEEPCISGTNGSGAVFFSGCNLKCTFCQNHEISRKENGKKFDEYQLKDLFQSLQDKNVHNINLVTASHFIRTVAKALEMAELNIPVVWNSSGYEDTETLKMLEGLVDIYLPDFKYWDSILAKKYSNAENYPKIASSAINEMYRQCGDYVIKDGLMVKGMIIRHLILPGYIENSMNVIDFVADNFNTDSVLFSLMSQFTIMPGCDIKRTVSYEENETLIHYMKTRKLSGFIQDISSSTDEMIPKFDLTGV